VSFLQIPTNMGILVVDYPIDYILVMFLDNFG